MNEQASPARPPAPRKRAWFQLHLSTCVVLMFAAGVLVWANVRRYIAPDVTFGRGWPFVFYRKIFQRSFHGPRELAPDWGKWPDPEYLIGPLLLNLVIGIALLAVIAVFCEWLIRRRRKSAASA